jgi:hypothetical protein
VRVAEDMPSGIDIRISAGIANATTPSSLRPGQRRDMLSGGIPRPAMKNTMIAHSRSPGHTKIASSDVAAIELSHWTEIQG